MAGVNKKPRRCGQGFCASGLLQMGDLWPGSYEGSAGQLSGLLTKTCVLGWRHGDDHSSAADALEVQEHHGAEIWEVGG